MNSSIVSNTLVCFAYSSAGHEIFFPANAALRPLLSRSSLLQVEVAFCLGRPHTTPVICVTSAWSWWGIAEWQRILFSVSTESCDSIALDGIMLLLLHLFVPGMGNGLPKFRPRHHICTSTYIQQCTSAFSVYRIFYGTIRLIWYRQQYYTIFSTRYDVCVPFWRFRRVCFSRVSSLSPEQKKSEICEKLIPDFHSTLLKSCLLVNIYNSSPP